ncbi:MAG: D-alanine--D-alanine ligase [bacterium]
MAYRLAVLQGGPSPEATISRQSGDAMAAALREHGHAVDQLECDRNIWNRLTELRPDCVVLALHGVPGEDGTVQGMLELLGLPYTGSGVAASAVAIDKVLTKQIAAQLGIPMARDVVARVNDPAAILTAINSAGLVWPLIVKGATAGSTIGLSKITAPGELGAALDESFAVSPRVLIEECAKGTEISVCLLGNDTPELLPTPEIVHDQDLFDYATKYTQGASHHAYPPRCDPAMVAQAERWTIDLYRLIGCAGCGRGDWIITATGPIFLELNTLPGMTALSLLPDAASQRGIAFPTVCERLVEAALQRRREVAMTAQASLGAG